MDGWVLNGSDSHEGMQNMELGGSVFPYDWGEVWRRNSKCNCQGIFRNSLRKNTGQWCGNEGNTSKARIIFASEKMESASVVIFILRAAR